MADDKTDIAKVVEGLDGPDREVDAEIALAVSYANCRPRTTEEYPKTPIENQYGHGIFPPAYTASIDAAMTLVPEGWSVGLGDLRGRDPVIWRAHLRDHNNPDPSTRQWVEGNCATPALALCAAALRARSRQGEG